MRIFSDFICAQIAMYHSHTVLLLLLSTTIALQVNIVERGIQIKILISLYQERDRERERERERERPSILGSSESLF